MDAAAEDALAACENCSTMLQGRYCHVCGQHAVNPMRHFGHAVEDFFESFWHLDGRVFRTLRDLLVPGRVACNYLAGQRVRYIAPLRLFVVLTVLTFFVGQIAVLASPASPVSTGADAPSGAVVFGGSGTQRDGFQNAKTEAEVNAVLARQVADIREAMDGAKAVPFAARGLQEAEKQVRAQAAGRIAELRAASPPVPPLAASPAPSTAPRARSGESAAVANGAAAGGRPDTASADASPASAAAEGQSGSSAHKGVQQMAASLGTLRDPKAEWHERENPVDIEGLAPFADRWVNHRIANVAHNTDRMAREGESMLFGLALAAVPPALFVLVPLFALLLKLLYAGSARGYLEHLVVALYSHAFMLLALLAAFVVMLLRASFPQVAAVGVASQAVQVALWIALPVYLFVMQHRVYRQHWLLTAVKYLALGAAYMFLVAMVVLYSVLAGISSGA